MPASDTLRRKWVAALAVMCAPTKDAEAAKALARMLPFFEDLPDEAFCRGSLLHVASQSAYVPSYAKLHELLLGYWNTNRPPPAPTRALRIAAVSEAEKSRLVRESWQDGRLVAASVRNAQAAVEKPGLSDSLGSLLGRLVAFHAPQHLGLVPPEWHPTEAT